MVARETVLLVEDNPQAVKVFSLYLAEAGYRVAVVPDGDRAVEAALRLRPGVIVLDLLLPGVDGWEVLVRLKACERTRAIPVVIASVLDRQSLGYELGAVDYLVKPVDRERLLQAIQRSLLYRDRPGDAVPRVLVVHEEQEALASLAHALASRGYRVFEALGGGEAHCLYDALELDLVVVCIGRQGLGVLAALEARGTARHVPVLVAAEPGMGPVLRARLRRGEHTVVAAGERMQERLLRSVARVLARPPDGQRA